LGREGAGRYSGPALGRAARSKARPPAAKIAPTTLLAYLFDE